MNREQKQTKGIKSKILNIDCDGNILKKSKAIANFFNSYFLNFDTDMQRVSAPPFLVKQRLSKTTYKIQKKSIRNIMKIQRLDTCRNA